MSPSKSSLLHTLLPPMRSGAPSSSSAPLAGASPDRAPLTYNRAFAPSYVTATWLQAWIGNADDPLT